MATSSLEPDLSEDSRSISMPEPEPQSAGLSETLTAVNELQDAVGSLVIHRKAKNDDSRPPTGTGAVGFFSFPRELRDEIYFYYLHHPGGITWRRHSPDDDMADNANDMIRLFLVSQQVHSEAWPIFCHSNSFNLGTRKAMRNALTNLLPLFPTKPTSLLQKVTYEYPANSFQRNKPWSEQELGSPKYPGEMWVQILRDAYTLKSHFPKLREFTARWHTRALYFDKDSLFLYTDFPDGEENVGKWLWWMRIWVKMRKIVPPPWVTFELNGDVIDKVIVTHELALNKAYARLVKETAASRVEELE